MAEQTVSKRNLVLVLFLLFVITSSTLYGHFNSGLELEVIENERYGDKPGIYQTVSYNITNKEDEEVKPQFWIINERNRRPLTTKVINRSISPSENVKINLTIDNHHKDLLYGSRYQLVILDKNSGRRYSQFLGPMRTEKRKNPYFIFSEGYPFHWTGSSFGKGDYYVDYKDNGLNGSFENCDNSGGCGMTYRDEFEFRDKIILKGESYNVDNKTRLEILIADEHNNLELRVDNISKKEKYSEFQYRANLKELYADLENTETPEKVKYTLKFKTRKNDFHWLKVTEFNFVNDD